MKFQIIYSIFLLGFNSLASAQTVFDYSLFQTGQNAKEINTKDIFRLEKFDACWDISFKYTLANGNSKTEVVPGDWVVNQLKIKPQNITTYVTEDREIIQLPRPDNLVEGKMFFTPKRSDDPLCEKKNEEMKNSLNLTASVLVSPKNTVANAVVESSDIPSERSPFYDAILLQKMLKNKEKDKVVALLSLYGINKDSLSNNEPLNNHINELFPNNIDSTTTLLVTNTETEKSTGIQGAGPSFVTTLTEALAQFIAKRVKEELTLAYLSRFRAYLEDKNQTIRIGVLLPESYKVMMEVEPYDYTTFWLAMQEGFQDDVAQFPENTMGFVRAHKARFKKDDSYAATITGLYLLRGTYRKYSAVAILDGMESLPEVKDFTSENVGASLRTLSLLSRNLHHFENNGSKSEGWIKSNELVALANKQTRDFFAGLLIAKEKEALADIQFKTSSTSLISLRVILLKNYKSPEFNKTLVDLLTQLNVLLDKEKQVGKESEQIEDETNTKKKVKTTFEKYETYAKALLDLVDHSREWVRKLAPENLKTIQVKQTLNAFSVITQATIDLTKHMSEKRYNLAFFDVMRLLKEVQGKHFNETIDTALALAGKPEKQKQLLENLSRLGISDADLSKLTDSEIQIARTNLKSIPIDKKEKLEQQVEKINNSMGALQNLLSPIAAGTSIDTATLRKISDQSSAFTTIQSELDKLNLKSDKKDLSTIIDQLTTYAANSKSSFWDWEKLAKYGSFISNVAGADSAAQIVAALEAAALPAGSYRIKHEDRFTVSLNAYGGLNYSREVFSFSSNVLTEEEEKNVKSTFTLSPYAPVGLSFSWGLKKQIIESLTLFVPVIDVGAAFALRFKSDLKALPDQLSWDNILAPGIHLVVGFRNSPLTFSLGAQYGAGLRKLEYDKDKTVPFSAQSVWYGATLAVDVPIFTLHVGKGYTRK